MTTGRASGGLSSGPSIKDYRLTGRLGAGAMGEVYEGVHALIGKRVAIKVLRSNTADPVAGPQRLLEEARAVNAIEHPGIVDIFDAGTLEDGRPYLVMERLEGHSLHQHLKRQPQLAPREVFQLLTGILEPLDAAHRAGVIHRDLKPSNVFLCDNPVGPPRVKLVDFGIARRASREEVLTQPLTTLGSLGFMGPEHLAGLVEPASDLYSVGCLAFQMLTGGPVFLVKGAAQLAQAHLEEPPPSVRSRRPDVPLELEAWVAWLLEKDPAARPSTAEVALAVLKEAEAAAAGVSTMPGGPRFGELARAFDRQARTQRTNPRHQPTPELSEGQRPTRPEATALRQSPGGTDLTPVFQPPEPAKRIPASELPTVLNWKRPDKP